MWTPMASATVPSCLRPSSRSWSSTATRLRRPLPPRILRPSFLCYSSGDGSNRTKLTDQILDYIEGGPKLRRWYGAPDLLSRDTVSKDLSPEGEEIRDAVLVTNGDSEMGQMVILSLILRRFRIKAIVKDKSATAAAFGTYVEPVTGNQGASLLRGVRAIIICPSASKEGFLSGVVGDTKTGVEHIVLLSQAAAYKGRSGFQALVDGNSRKLAERDEEAVIKSGIPYTIIRSGLLQDGPGWVGGFSFGEGAAARRRLSMEDAAHICVEALAVVPPTGIVVEVASGEEKISDWKQVFLSLVEKEGPVG